MTSLAYKDEDGLPLVDKILDAAEQKGTGKWTGISALEMGIPLTMVVEAVLGRALSALKDERAAGFQSALRARLHDQQSLKRSSSTTWNRLSTPPSSCPTPRDTCSSARPPRNTSGI